MPNLSFSAPIRDVGTAPAERGRPRGAGWGARIAQLTLVAALAALGLLFAADPAIAHASLVASSPADGAVWNSPPTEVRLQFKGPVTVPSDGVRVLDRHGDRVDADPVGQGAPADEISLGLRPDLPIGTYVVTWRVVSDDSHPVSGALVFSVGVPGAGDPLDPVPPPLEPGLTAADTAVRGAWNLGGFMAVGGVVFLLAMREDDGRYRLPVRRVTLVAALTGAAATAVGLPVQAALTAGRWSALLELDAVLASPFGAAAATRVGGMMLITAGIATRRPVLGHWMCGVGAVAAVVSVVQSGHAATTTPRALAIGAYLVHAAAAAIWFGGLVALAICLWRGRGSTDDTAAARMAVRYSAFAAAAVIAIGVAGLMLAYLQVGTVDRLASGYGLTLLLKVGLVAVAGVLGWYNRTRLITVLRRAPGRQHLSALRRLVTVEAAAIAVVLMVTAVLTALEPPRADAAPPSAPVSATMPIGDLTVLMTVDPARVGINTVTFAFTDANGTPAHPGDEVSVEFSLPERDIAQISRIPARTGTGTYHHQGPELSLPGRWRVEVQVRTSDFTFDAQHVEVPLLDTPHP